MVERLNFDDQIFANKLKSSLLVVGIVLVFAVLGYVIALVWNPAEFFLIMIVAIVFSLGYTLVSYYYSDKIALMSVKAKQASHSLHKQLYNAVENMSLASGLPMPKVYVMESSEINAFASGRNPENAIICVTTGTLQKLDKEELEGVIAHEMSHIANYDIRFMTLTAVLVGMVAIIGEIYLRSLWFKSDNRDNKAGAILMIVGIVFAILAPILVQLISLAISRKREFGADATGAKFTRYPKGLANALRKIKHEHITAREPEKHYNKALAPLFISDPFKRKFQDLFSTHPNIDDRIERLERM